RELAREAAGRSVVLLRDDGLLPLRVPERGPEGASSGPETSGASTSKPQPSASEDPPARIAVVGPHANRVPTDWYSGTLPYHVSLADAVRERWPAARVDVVTGADRVALRTRDTAAWVSVDDDGTVTARASEPTFDTWFDVTDWGDGLLTLRSVASGK